MTSHTSVTSTPFALKWEAVPELDAAATLADDGSVTIFAVNRSLEEDIELAVDLRDFPGLSSVSHEVLSHPDLKAVNTENQPDNVRPVQGEGGVLYGGRLTVRVPKASWNVVRITVGIEN